MACLMATLISSSIDSEDGARRLWSGEVGGKRGEGGGGNTYITHFLPPSPSLPEIASVFSVFVFSEEH